jgi:hypothetical protein
MLDKSVSRLCRVRQRSYPSPLSGPGPADGTGFGSFGSFHGSFQRTRCLSQTRWEVTRYYADATATGKRQTPRWCRAV